MSYWTFKHSGLNFQLMNWTLALTRFFIQRRHEMGARKERTVKHKYIKTFGKDIHQYAQLRKIESKSNP